MPSQRTIDQANKALDGLEVIVRNERFVHGEYITQDVDPMHSGAACKGHKACLLGSLWIGAGVPIKRFAHSRAAFLPGLTDGAPRDEFLRYRPGLRLAFDALNTAADRRIARLSPYKQNLIMVRARGLCREWPSSAEGLFECEKLGRTDLLRLIASARKIVNDAA
jgi:hypothetical protein